MEVKGPSKASETKKSSKTSGVKSTGTMGFNALIEAAGGAETTEATVGAGGVGSVQNIDALLSAQETPDSTAEGGNRRAKMRADAILQSLDEIRIGLLTGSLRKSTLEDLTKVIKAHREKIMDDKLAEIIDEIDLRAQVEIAKYEQ